MRGGTLMDPGFPLGSIVKARLERSGPFYSTCHGRPEYLTAGTLRTHLLQNVPPDGEDPPDVFVADKMNKKIAYLTVSSSLPWSP